MSRSRIRIAAARGLLRVIDLIGRAGGTRSGAGTCPSHRLPGPQADLRVPGQQPIPLGTVEPGYPTTTACGEMRIALRLHTIDDRVIDVTVHDPAWIGELADQIQVLQRRTRTLFGDSTGGSK